MKNQITKAIYVSQLSEEEQSQNLSKIKQRLIYEGYENEAIEEALRDALDSKIADIQHVL
ncbi:hypothetical protein D3C73_791970 [compost metagenome]